MDRDLISQEYTKFSGSQRKIRQAAKYAPALTLSNIYINALFNYDNALNDCDQF